MHEYKQYLQHIIDWLFPRTDLERTTSETLFAKRVHFSTDSLHTLLDPNVHILFSYKDSLVRNLLWQLKYKNSHHAAGLLGEVLTQELLELLADHVYFSDLHSIVLIPMPLSHKREKERGYNQMMRVCEHISPSLGLTIHTRLLVRHKHTLPQTHIAKRQERINNVKDIFTLADTVNVSNKHVILVDDIITTGATMREAKHTLMHAGAQEVHCIALAH